MDSEHRKIELQSPADLAYLTAQLRTLARHKLDLHLPAQASAAGGAPDELRAHVEALVDGFVAQVLAGMRLNISINGLDVVSRGAPDENGEVRAADDVENVEAVVEEFEPLDERLRERLRGATQAREALVSKISVHRRRTAREAAERFREGFVREREEWEGGRRGVVGEGGGDGEGEVVGVEALKRQAEVERSWERAVEGLGRLNKGLPETRARLERCQDVVGYLGGTKETA